jgi:hypothetical protein
MHKLLDTVALAQDIPSAKLRRGDLGAVVEILAPDALEVEFVAASGKTEALLTLHPDAVRQVGDRDLLAVRPLEETGD